MPNHNELFDFITQAQQRGVPETSLVGVLKGRGWSEKEIYEGIATVCERQTGLMVPSRIAGQTGARDAFFYLVAFSTLATWTIGLGSVAFTLIDRWLSDPLFASFAFDDETLPFSIASVIVAFPIYLLITRSIARAIAFKPEKASSPVRKWLTYMALVIAAAIFTGDLIACLASYLHGELTARFVAKSLVVLVLSGGIFHYYFGGLGSREEAAPPTRSNRDKWMAIVTSVLVIALVALGFARVGDPARRRKLRADEKRVEDLSALMLEVTQYRSADATIVPEALAGIRGGRTVDPETRAPYEYHPLENGQYQLCATFALSSPSGPTRLDHRWDHPAGHYCFTLQKGQYP